MLVLSSLVRTKRCLVAATPVSRYVFARGTFVSRADRPFRRLVQTAPLLSLMGLIDELWSSGRRISKIAHHLSLRLVE
jgi:hypothetical protein